MDVNFVGNFNPTGVGRHSEMSFFATLRHRRNGVVPFYVDARRPGSMFRLARESRNQSGVSLLFWRWSPEELRSRIPGKRIAWLFFESDVVPPAWLRQIEALDELWMPSAWAKEVLEKHAIPARKIRVVTSGVDGETYRPAPVAHERFVFLLVGKYERRKSVDEAILAFRLEFPRERDADVEFWIKAEHPVFPERVVALHNQIRDDGRIRLVTGLLDDDGLAGLYNRADAFVFPTKAEGFGLPTVEALACGLPVITTNVSAQAEFLQHVPGLFLEVTGKTVPIVDPDYAHFYGGEYGSTPFGTWLQPDIDSIRARMREVYENHGAWKERAGRASAIIRERFAWDAVGKRVNDVLLGAG